MLESKRSYDAGGALPRKRSDEIVATRNDGGSHLGSFARRYMFFQFPIIGSICILFKIVLGSFQRLDLICFFDVCFSKKKLKDDTKPPR